MDNVKDLLKKAAGDVLTEDTLNAIQSAFDTTVNERVDAKVNDRIKLEVGNALTEQDDQHAIKLEKLLEAVDSDHVNKLKAVVKKLDESHSDKLRWIVKKYRTQMQTEAAKLRDTLINQVSNYLDLYLDKTIPQEQIAEAVKNRQACKLLESIKKVLVVDPDFVTAEIKEAMLDGKTQIDDLKKQLNKTIQENVELHQTANKAKTEKLLLERTIDLPRNKAEYVKKVLGDKDPEYITENFDYVVEMFERDQQEEVELVRETAGDRTVSRKVDRPVAKEEDQKSTTPVTGYLSEMANFDRKRGEPVAA